MNTVRCAKCQYVCRRLESSDGLIIHACRVEGCGWRQATLKLEWIS
jgi:hypothetical protein